MAIAHQIPRGTVTATLNYYKPPADGAAPYNLIDPAGPVQRNYSDTPHPTTIHDVRGSESSFTLDHDAFQLIPSVPPSAADFTSEDSIRDVYYPEVTALLLSHIPGSHTVHIFDHTIRRPSGSPARGPVQRAHIDQTGPAAAARVRRHLPDDADRLLQGRYRIVNVWRTLNAGPVESFPLAFASSATLAEDDVVPVEHRYKTGYTGETAAIKYNPEQRWHYWSGMTGDERVLLECFDSEGGPQGRRVAHSAFEDPRTKEGAEGRESIEVRALVFGP